MNNSYYDPYSQPYCRTPVKTCKCNLPVEREDDRLDRCEHTKTHECEKCAVPEMNINAAIAMAYVPVQCFDEVYDCCKALKRGTLFKKLDKPFKGCCRYE